MSTPLRREDVTTELKALITEGFKRHSIEHTGIDGVRDQPVAFVSYDSKDAVKGAVVVMVFWGQLHVKTLWVAEDWRGTGLARELMEKAHDYGRSHKCDFAFVETMSFQAEGFYQKLGYTTEFRRDGYAAGTAFVYMQKNLKED